MIYAGKARKMTDKLRADQALVQRGLFESRGKAQAAIMAGSVYIGEKKMSILL